jgi:hypothetical protein
MSSLSKINSTMVDIPNLVTFFRHLYLGGMWFGVTPKIIYQKSMCSKDIELCAENMITIPGSIVDKIGEG